MTENQSTEFFEEIKEQLSQGFDTESGRIAVDSIERVPLPAAEQVSIDFHIEGPRATTARFTYVFSTDRSVEENLRDLRDFLEETKLHIQKMEDRND